MTKAGTHCLCSLSPGNYSSSCWSSQCTLGFQKKDRKKFVPLIHWETLSSSSSSSSFSLWLCVCRLSHFILPFSVSPFFGKWMSDRASEQVYAICMLITVDAGAGSLAPAPASALWCWSHGHKAEYFCFLLFFLLLLLLWGRHAAQFVRGRQNVEATVKAGRKPAAVVDEDDDCAHDFFFGFSLSPSLTTIWRRLREMKKKKKKKCLKCRHTHTVAQSHSGVKCEIIIYSHFFFSPPAAVPSPPVCYWRSNSGDRGGGHWQYSTYTQTHTDIHFKMKMKRMKEEEELDCSALAGCCHFVDN